MQAAILAAVASFLMIGRRKHHVAFLVHVIV